MVALDTRVHPAGVKPGFTLEELEVRYMLGARQVRVVIATHGVRAHQHGPRGLRRDLDEDLCLRQCGAGKGQRMNRPILPRRFSFADLKRLFRRFDRRHRVVQLQVATVRITRR